MNEPFSAVPAQRGDCRYASAIPEEKLPPLMHSHQQVGRLRPAIADVLGVFQV
jgi:hypothetical protein